MKSKKKEIEMLPASIYYHEFNLLLKKLNGIPSPKQLYKSLFFRGDLAILFGPTYCGKSLFAVMIAEEVYKAYQEMMFKDFSVLYFDLEMFEQQQQMRYTDLATEKYHEFPDKLFRVHIHEDKIRKLTVENMYELFENVIFETNAKAIIIDNFTCLCKGKKASTAALFFQNLRILRNRHHLSVLIVAHSKKRNDFKPITIADLNGSSFMAAAADSIFALNISRKGKDIRYVKQLKSRDSEIEYGEDNVLEYKIKRDKDGMLRLNLQGTTTEDEQIEIDDIAKHEMEDKIRLMNTKGKSIREIAKKLKISPSRVYRCLH